MNKAQGFGYRALRRVQRFLTELKLGAGTKLATLVALFLAQLAQVELLFEEQKVADAEAHALTGQLKEQLRALVIDHLRPIARGARLFFGRDAGAMAQFRLPAVDARLEEVLGGAAAMASAASGIEARLVEHGLAPDFLAQLRGAMEAIRETADRRDRALERRGGATVGLRAAMRQARETVRFLNALLVIELRSDPRRLEEWRLAMRIADVPAARREKEGEEAAPEVAAVATPGAVAAPVVVSPASAAPEAAVPSASQATA